MVESYTFVLLFDEDTTSELCHFTGSCDELNNSTPSDNNSKDDDEKSQIDRILDACEKYSSQEDRESCELGIDIIDILVPNENFAVQGAQVCLGALALIGLATI